VTGTGWLSVALSLTAAVSARWIGQEQTRTAGAALGLAAQPGWIVLSLLTGTWGFLGATAYWIYTYLRVSGWWPRWLPAPQWPVLLRRLPRRRGRYHARDRDPGRAGRESIG
jgi:hypothetical protein